MNTTQIDWHPWPEEKPPEKGWYVVTKPALESSLVPEGPWVDWVYFDGNVWKSTFFTAWAYPIEPYQGKE